MNKKDHRRQQLYWLDAYVWSLSESVVSSVITIGSSSLKRSFRAGNDLSMLYILTRSLIRVADGSNFTLPADDDSDFNILEASFWKIFVLTV